MDFFERQTRARRNTAWLVVLYAAAVVVIVIAVDLVFAGLWMQPDLGGGIAASRDGLPPVLQWVLRAVIVAVILIASMRKVLQLADGGHAVAAMVGARLVDPATTNLRERRLINVVEEMALASGTAVPGVYIMDDERAINAFAAGYQPNAAVVAVTRGTLEQLNRDELQGVIAHEFSHILNGDMRLNVRMLGVLHGISVIGSIGRFMVRGSGDSRSGGRGRSQGPVAIGLALWAIGSIGVLFARLIKAAVSRQREFLADASSVQFTRNPDAIAGALDRIGATGAGTLIDNRYAEELSHMYFGQSVKMWLASLMDTHPPIAQRIERVRPGFLARRYRAARSDDAAATAQPVQGLDEIAGAAPLVSAVSSGAGTGPHGPRPTATASAAAARVVASIGNPSLAHVRHARDLLAQLPPGMRDLAGQSDGAQALGLAVILSTDAPRPAPRSCARSSPPRAVRSHRRQRASRTRCARSDPPWRCPCSISPRLR